MLMRKGAWHFFFGEGGVEADVPEREGGDYAAYNLNLRLISWSLPPPGEG